MNRTIAGILFLVLTLSTARGAERAVVISAAKPDADGVPIHEVTCPFEAGTTRIRVLLPDKLDAGKTFPVVYVLPVEAGDDNRFGNGLLEVKKKDLANKYAAVFVAPTFSHLPWYADHPTNPEIR